MWLHQRCWDEASWSVDQWERSACAQFSIPLYPVARCISAYREMKRDIKLRSAYRERWKRRSTLQCCQATVSIGSVRAKKSGPGAEMSLRLVCPCSELTSEGCRRNRGDSPPRLFRVISHQGASQIPRRPPLRHPHQPKVSTATAQSRAVEGTSQECFCNGAPPSAAPTPTPGPPRRPAEAARRLRSVPCGQAKVSVGARGRRVPPMLRVQAGVRVQDRT